ncbi:lysin A [Microbacterium phage TurboVicky]|nr:lysin A [Microbacterium phage TurboVicky]
MVEFKWWGNARVTPWMHYQLSRLDADLRRFFGVGLVANSGIRLAQEQLDIWYARYTRTPNGRRVYDTRWWNGQLWYRISPAGTVAQPGTSNHEIQGSKAAVDIQDTGADAGITSKNSTRGRWIRANASNYSLIASGDGFGEGWHFDITGIYNNVPGAPAGGGGTAIPKEDDMTVAVKLNNKHLYTMGEEFISHNGSVAQHEVAKNVNSAQDEQHKLDTAQFLNYLDAMGIPRGAVDVNSGAVLNPQSGKMEGNGVWSRRREAVALAEKNAETLAEILKLVKPAAKAAPTTPAK